MHLNPLKAAFDPKTTITLHSQPFRPLQVDTTLGDRALSDCFLLPADVSVQLGSDILQLTPTLKVQHADQTPSWGFLKSLGVSMDFDWEATVKLLRQLSNSRAAPGLGSMRKLYQRIQSFCGLDSTLADSVRDAFEGDPLIVLPDGKVKRQIEGVERVVDMFGQQGHWVCSSEVLWSGNPAVFCHKIFIQPYYKVCG